MMLMPPWREAAPHESAARRDRERRNNENNQSPYPESCTLTFLSVTSELRCVPAIHKWYPSGALRPRYATDPQSDCDSPTGSGSAATDPSAPPTCRRETDDPDKHWSKPEDRRGFAPQIP